MNRLRSTRIVTTRNDFENGKTTQQIEVNVRVSLDPSESQVTTSYRQSLIPDHMIVSWVYSEDTGRFVVDSVFLQGPRALKDGSPGVNRVKHVLYNRYASDHGPERSWIWNLAEQTRPI